MLEVTVKRMKHKKIIQKIKLTKIMKEMQKFKLTYLNLTIKKVPNAKLMSTHLLMVHQIHVLVQMIAKARDIVHLLDGAEANHFAVVYYLTEFMTHQKKLAKDNL